jgi:phosphatidylglycerol---prolipoprotein diacylglyceryl transferase
MLNKGQPSLLAVLFLMLAVLPYPSIDPIAISLGPFDIRWYSLAYIVGLILAWQVCRYLAKTYSKSITAEHFDDFVAYCALGIILGGRLGYVLFYNFQTYIQNPIEILYVWQGGMSFHGGLLGVVVAILWFARSRSISQYELADMIVVVGPIGLLLGRMANFINGELYGRVTDFSWAFIFPTSGDGLPRHASQLYEASLEGVVLGLLLFGLYRVDSVRERLGTITGLFFLGYGISRFLVEYVREPDQHIGFLFDFITMGQLLSLPLIIAGILFITFAPKFNGAKS